MGHMILPSFVHSTVCPFIKLFCACHILRNLHAKVLKFYIWVPNEKIADPYFVSCLACLLELYPFEKKKKKKNKSCEQDISKSI